MSTTLITERFPTSNQFADEEVPSPYVYPSGYKVRGITVQTYRLREFLPGIGYTDESIANQPLPKGAEGWFIIPRWEKLASTYGEAVEKVLAAIGTQRDGELYNFRKGRLGPQYLHQHERTVRMLQMLGDQQKDYDILVVPAQFGRRHRGRSDRRAREVMSANEFGLGAFVVGCMFLTHPERLVSYHDLWVSCAGDESAQSAGGQFDSAPSFDFRDLCVAFDAHEVSHAHGGFGSASAFLLQLVL